MAVFRADPYKNFMAISTNWGSFFLVSIVGPLFFWEPPYSRWHRVYGICYTMYHP